MDDKPNSGDLDAVSTRDGLAVLLREVHVRADRPSLRDLEKKTVHSDTPLSRTALSEMLNGGRLPRKAVMVAFLRECGVQDDVIDLWQGAWERVASLEAEQARLVATRATSSQQRRVANVPPPPRNTARLVARDTRAHKADAYPRRPQRTVVADLPDVGSAHPRPRQPQGKHRSHGKGSMSPADPGLLRLAQRLRELREQQWPDVRLTQGALAKGLGSEERLSPATLSSWENPISPKLPPHSRMSAYARFFATRRSVEGDQPRLIAVGSLTNDERDTYEALETELLALRYAAKKPSVKDEVAVTRSWRFSDSGPVTLICAGLPEAEKGSLADPVDPNYTEYLSYADLDALVELYGHIRAENPVLQVDPKLSSSVAPNDLSGHVVLLGGIGWNEITQRLSEMTSLPVRQIEDPAVETGEIFVVDRDGTEQRFLPVWEDDGNTLIEDVGLIARTPNPINSNRSLTICNGIHSRGVLGAVRTLTDPRLRDSNEKYIVENFIGSSYFAILMRVLVVAGKTMTPDLHGGNCVLYQWPHIRS